MNQNNKTQENAFVQTSWKLKRSMNFFNETKKKEKGGILSNGNFNLDLYVKFLKARGFEQSLRNIVEHG